MILIAYVWYDMGWGWTITILLGFFVFAWIARLTLKLSMFSTVILAILVFLLFFVITGIYLDVPFCAFVDETSLMFLN